jgi:hypothetical protein
VIDTSADSDVVLVSANGAPARDAFYVSQALAAAPAGGSAGWHVAGASPPQLGEAAGSRLAHAGAVLLLSTRGLEPRGRQALAAYVRSGGGLLIAAGPEVDGDVVADMLGAGNRLTIAGLDAAGAGDGAARALVPTDARHPVFQPFGPDSGAFALVTFRRIARVEGEGCRTAARFTSGEAALQDCAVGAGRVLVFASDLGGAWNDFPRRAAFVPFLQEVVRYLASGRRLGRSFLIGNRPAGVPPQPGIVTLPARDGEAARQIAVNVDPRELDAARLSTDAFLSAVAPVDATTATPEASAAREDEARQRLWQYALGLMLAALVAESVVAARST